MFFVDVWYQRDSKFDVEFHYGERKEIFPKKLCVFLNTATPLKPRLG